MTLLLRLASFLLPIPLSGLLLGCTELKTSDSPSDAGEVPADAAPPQDASESKPDTGAACADGCGARAGTCAGGVATTYLGAGRCVDGQCVYTEVKRTCKAGSCQSGICEELEWAEDPPAGGKAIYSVWGPAPDDVWAVGEGVYHWNGSGWTDETSKIGLPITATQKAWSVHGSGADDVVILVGEGFASGGPGRVLRKDGDTWRNVHTITNEVNGGAVRALGSKRYVIHAASAIFYAAPGTTTFVKSLGPFIAGHLLANSLSGPINGGVLAAGYGNDGSVMYQLSGGTAQPYADRATAVVYRRDVVGGIFAGDLVWLYEPGTARSLGATKMSDASGLTSGYWQAIDGTGLDRLFVAGSEGQVMRRSREGWKKEPVLPNKGPVVYLWASPWGDVYAAGKTLWRGR